MGPVPKKVFDWQSPPSPSACCLISEETFIPPISISVLQVETVEMCIDEEADELTASLLLLPADNQNNAGVHLPQSVPTEATGPIECSCCCSPQGLAVTSVVAGEHHAHTAVHKLLTIPTGFSISIDGTGTSGVQREQVATIGDGLLAQCLKLESTTGWAQFTGQWARHCLAFTDNPGLVSVIKADVTRLFTAGGPSQRCTPTTPKIRVVSCAEAGRLTSCQADCCQADVEMLPSAVGCGPHAQTLIPLTGVCNKLYLSAPANLQLLPMPGLTVDIMHDPVLCCFSMTYLLLLLTADDQQTPAAKPATASPWTDLDMMLVLPASVKPWSTSTVHQFFSRSVGISTLSSTCCPTSTQRRLALTVLVDVVQSTDDNGRKHITAVVHERYHHLPELDLSLISFAN